MKFKSFYYRVIIRLDLTEEEVQLLIELSDSHSSTACIAAGRPDGFLQDWLFCVKEELRIEADFRALDTAAKILEIRQFHFDTEETRAKLEMSCVLTEEVNLLLRQINAEYARINKGEK